MEIYHKKITWLGFVFFMPAVWLSLSLVGYTPLTIPSSESTAAYVVIGICLLVALQCFMGSTRFYFDKDEQMAFQIRKHFYGEKVIEIPFKDINEITVRCYRRASQRLTTFKVGYTESTNLFGGNAIKFTPLRTFDDTENGLSLAREFAQEICSYTKIRFFDDSNTIRAEMGNHFGN